MTNKIFNIFYLAITTALVLVSCRDTLSPEGDLLNNIDYTAHTLGDDRYLYQEVTSSDTLAEYRYSGKQLIYIKGLKQQTNISYSGDFVNQITHSKTTATDSIYITQSMVYNISGSGKLDKITEDKSRYEQPTIPGNPLTETKYRSEYDITYNLAGKVSTILIKEGTVTTAPFVFTTYKKITLTYDTQNKNVLTNKIEIGTVSNNTLSTPTIEQNYTYSEYDGLKSPYRLLPNEYHIFRLTQGTGAEAYIFSKETPELLQLQGTNVPVPQDIPNKNLKYDADKYLILGWNRVFEYRPL